MQVIVSPRLENSCFDYQAPPFPDDPEQQRDELRKLLVYLWTSRQCPDTLPAVLDQLGLVYLPDTDLETPETLDELLAILSPETLLTSK